MFTKEFANRVIKQAFAGEVWVSIVGQKDGANGIDEISDRHRIPRVRMQKSMAMDGEIKNTNELIFRFLPKCRLTHFGISESEFAAPICIFPMAVAKDFKDGDSLAVEPGDVMLVIPHGNL